MFTVILSAVEAPAVLDSSSVLEFHGDSYVELKLSNNVAETFAYDIWFLPIKSDGKLSTTYILDATLNRRLTSATHGRIVCGEFGG